MAKNTVQKSDRRAFLKLLTFGSLAAVAGLGMKKIDDMTSLARTGSSKTSKKIAIAKGLSYKETKKEVIFYGSTGEQVIIFEKDL